MCSFPGYYANRGSETQQASSDVVARQTGLEPARPCGLLAVFRTVALPLGLLPHVVPRQGLEPWTIRL